MCAHGVRKCRNRARVLTAPGARVRVVAHSFRIYFRIVNNRQCHLPETITLKRVPGCQGVDQLPRPRPTAPRAPPRAAPWPCRRWTPGRSPALRAPVRRRAHNAGATRACAWGRAIPQERRQERRVSVDAHMNTTQGLGSGRWHCQSSRRLNSCKKPAPSPEERHSASRRRAPVPRAPALAVVAGAATRALRPHPPRDPRPAPVRRIDLMFTRRRRRGGAAGGAERLRPAALTMVSRGLGCSEAPARCTGHRLQATGRPWHLIEAS